MYHSLFFFFFTHTSVSGCLGCFHDLAIVNSADMNIGVHVPFSILVSSGYMLSSGIVGSYGHLTPSFWRNLHTVFVGILYIIWIQVICQIAVLQIFSFFLWFAFSFSFWSNRMPRDWFKMNIKIILSIITIFKKLPTRNQNSPNQALWTSRCSSWI